VAVITLTLGATFIYLYASMLGESPLRFWHHLAVILPLIALCYGLVGLCTCIRSRATRQVSAWLVCLVFTLLQLGFYLACLACLYGFRDLPTLHVVIGYLDQLISIVSVLPLSGGLLALVVVLILAAFASTAAAFAWLLVPAMMHSGVGEGPRKVWLRLTTISAVALVLLVWDPWGGLVEAREPFVRSLHDQPLGSSTLMSQINPIEAATDRRIEESYPRQPLGSRRNVVLIYVDALRADVLQPYGGPGEMPFLARLVQTGQLQQFANVFASCSQTQCGIGSLLQSRPAHRVAATNFSLPKLLKRQGYQLRYLLSSDHQSFLGLKDYYGPDIDFYLDGKDMDRQHSTDDFVMLRHLDDLPAANQVQAPQFIMFGLLSVHILGTRHDEFRLHRPDEIGPLNLIKELKPSALVYRNNYLNGVRQADHVLQTIWAWLERNGYLDRSIVVITADHGESLGENGVLGHGRDLSTPQIHIPLWIHAPGVSWTSQPWAYQTDMAPTVLDWLRLPIPENWVGQSLLRPRDGRVPLPLFFLNRSDQFGLIFEKSGRLYKYLYDRSHNRAALYDVIEDGSDARDLSMRQSRTDLAGLQARLVEIFGSQLLR
jgi:glucan phosphoethanolaminetransferase (alkaline phosphatase superfamily)